MTNNNDLRIQALEASVSELGNLRAKRGWRSRWAAVGAAVAITMGGGTALHYASAAPGDVVTTSFVSISPVRILDTRPAPENVGGFVGPLTAGQTHTFQVAGVAGVPSNATAVVLNVTVNGTTASSYLTMYPAGVNRPTASNLNWAAGQTIPNLVTVQLGASGKVSMYNLAGGTQVIADVAGYYAPGNDKFISLDMFNSTDDSAVYSAGFGDANGLSFIDGVSQSGSFHFVLPPDYTAGTDLVGTMTWHTNAASCSIAWLPNYVSVARPGFIHPVGADGATDGMVGPSLTATGASEVIQSTTFILRSPTPGFTLQAGDSYTFGIFRAGALGTDTCAGTALMDSVVIRYE